MADPEESQESPTEGAPHAIFWVDAHGRLRYSCKGVGTFSLLGWCVVMVSFLTKLCLGEKMS